MPLFTNAIVPGPRTRQLEVESLTEKDRLSVHHPKHTEALKFT